jgi:outer membrane protein
MKKIVLLSILASSVLLQADLIRTEIGGGVWSQSSSGTLQHKKDTYAIDLVDDLDVSNSQDMYLWAYVKHPIPLVPNARLEYTNTTLDGSGSGFAYNTMQYPSRTHYEIKIQQIDAILYYNILDNLAWITIDLGLDFNFMDSSYQFSNNSKVSDSIIVPMLYGRGRFEIPGTGFGLESELKYFTYGDSTVGDIRAKVDYTFDLTLIDPAIELGYRHEIINTSTNDFSDLSNDTDITMSGVYLGVMLRY